MRGTAFSAGLEAPKMEKIYRNCSISGLLARRLVEGGYIRQE